jgi:hypothetical protein
LVAARLLLLGAMWPMQTEPPFIILHGPSHPKLSCNEAVPALEISFGTLPIRLRGSCSSVSQ